MLSEQKELKSNWRKFQSKMNERQDSFNETTIKLDLFLQLSPSLATSWFCLQEGWLYFFSGLNNWEFQPYV